MSFSQNLIFLMNLKTLKTIQMAVKGEKMLTSGILHMKELKKDILS